MGFRIVDGLWGIIMYYVAGEGKVVRRMIMRLRLTPEKKGGCGGEGRRVQKGHRLGAEPII
jgi:hypothetical protein